MFYGPTEDRPQGSSCLKRKVTAMEFLAENWIYILVLVLFVAMHLVGSGGGHGRRPAHRPRAGPPTERR